MMPFISDAADIDEVGLSRSSKNPPYNHNQLIIAKLQAQCRMYERILDSLEDPISIIAKSTESIVFANRCHRERQKDIDLNNKYVKNENSKNGAHPDSHPVRPLPIRYEEIVLELEGDMEARIQPMAVPDSLMTVFDALPQIVWTTTPDGQLLYKNRRWIDYTGMPAFPWNWGEFVHPEDKQGLLTEWERCLRSAEDFEYEYRIRDKCDQYSWFLARGNPCCKSNLYSIIMCNSYFQCFNGFCR
jgi:PAS domain-containing protein